MEQQRRGRGRCECQWCGHGPCGGVGDGHRVERGKSGSAEVSVSLGEGTYTNITYCTIGGVADKMDRIHPGRERAPAATGGGARARGRLGQRHALHRRAVHRGQEHAARPWGRRSQRGLPSRPHPQVSRPDPGPAVRGPSSARSSGAAMGWIRTASGRGEEVRGPAGGAARHRRSKTTGSPSPENFRASRAGCRRWPPIPPSPTSPTPRNCSTTTVADSRTWPDPDSPEMIQASPVTHVSADDPPFFLIVGEDDELVMNAQSARLDQRLQACRRRVVAAAGTPRGPRPSADRRAHVPSSAAINDRIVDLLDQHLH